MSFTRQYSRVFFSFQGSLCSYFPSWRTQAVKSTQYQIMICIGQRKRTREYYVFSLLFKRFKLSKGLASTNSIWRCFTNPTLTFKFVISGQIYVKATKRRSYRVNVCLSSVRFVIYKPAEMAYKKTNFYDSNSIDPKLSLVICALKVKNKKNAGSSWNTRGRGLKSDLR